MTVMETLLQKMLAAKSSDYFTIKQALNLHLKDIDDTYFEDSVKQLTNITHLRHLISCGLSLDRLRIVTSQIDLLQKLGGG